MKIKRIKRLIESLNEKEIKYLNFLLEEKTEKDTLVKVYNLVEGDVFSLIDKISVRSNIFITELSYNKYKDIEFQVLSNNHTNIVFTPLHKEDRSKISKSLYYENETLKMPTQDSQVRLLSSTKKEGEASTDIHPKQLAQQIENNEIEETKELLMKRVEKGYQKGYTVAHYLASNLPKWTTNDKDVLMLQDKDGKSVAHILASKSERTKWSTKDKEILMLQDTNGKSVAYYLASNSGETKWKTNDKDVLMLQDRWEESVAGELAYEHPTWSTDDPDLLKLKSGIANPLTVRQILKNKRKLN